MPHISAYLSRTAGDPNLQRASKSPKGLVRLQTNGAYLSGF